MIKCSIDRGMYEGFRKKKIRRYSEISKNQQAIQVDEEVNQQNSIPSQRLKISRKLRSNSSRFRALARHIGFKRSPRGRVTERERCTAGQELWCHFIKWFGLANISRIRFAIYFSSIVLSTCWKGVYGARASCTLERMNSIFEITQRFSLFLGFLSSLKIL